MSHVSTGAAIGAGIGLLAAPFTEGLSLGLLASAGAGIGATAGAAYDINKSLSAAQKMQNNTLTDSIATPPTPAPAATPATLAQAASASRATKANATSGIPTKARAGGTIGAEGPQGLITPPQTANLTLLGGTR